jgi:hypothetical protein
MTNNDEQILHPRGALRQLRNPAQLRNVRL